jgi:hypothetical protein
MHKDLKVPTLMFRRIVLPTRSPLLPASHSDIV